MAFLGLNLQNVDLSAFKFQPCLIWFLSLLDEAPKLSPIIHIADASFIHLGKFFSTFTFPMEQIMCKGDELLNERADRLCTFLGEMTHLHLSLEELLVEISSADLWHTILLLAYLLSTNPDIAF